MAARTKPIYAFIDSQNLNLAIRSLGWKLDFSQLCIYLKDKFKVKKSFLFIGYLKENQKLYEYLQKENKLRRLIIPNQHKYSALLRRFNEKITFLNPLKKRLSASKTRRGGH